MRALSPAQQAAVRRYVRPEDRCRALIGKILVKSLLNAFGLDGNLVRKIRFTEYGRPYLDLPLDFNLSHSGGLVICAGSLDCRVGIDVEAFRNRDYRAFKTFFTAREWRQVEGAEDSTATFYGIWVRKESVIKADGRGLSYPLNEMDVTKEVVIVQNFTWYLTALDHWLGYAVSLATSHLRPHVDIQEQIL